MFNLLAKLLTGVSTLSVGTENQFCAMWFVDEPECPKSLIEK